MGTRVRRGGLFGTVRKVGRRLRQMRPQDLLEFTRRRPFAPFRICMTDGRSYDVRHPDQVIVLRSRAVVGIGGNGVAESVVDVALVHVVRLERLDGES